MRLYEHMTVHGWACCTTRWNARRYISRRVRSSTSALTRMRSVSWLLTAKCLSDAPTPRLCRPRTHSVASTPVSSGSSA